MNISHSLSVQALEWIHDNGEFYLSTHTSTGSSIQHTQELLKEHEEFQITAKVRADLLCAPVSGLHVCRGFSRIASSRVLWVNEGVLK